MIPRARWAHTKESTLRLGAWRVRARSRASLALGSALACAIVTSALLLSGSVRSLRGAFGAGRHETPAAAEAAPHKAPALQQGTAGDVTRSRTSPRSDSALGSRDHRLFEVAQARAIQARSMVPRSHGADTARGYDAMAPPGEHA